MAASPDSPVSPFPFPDCILPGLPTPETRMRIPTRLPGRPAAGHLRLATGLLLAVLPLSILGCAAPPTPEDDAPSSQAGGPALGGIATGESVRLVDLGHPLAPDSIYWPTGSPFVHERLQWGTTEAGYFYASASFSSPEHLGTHVDAPIHFAEGGATTAEIPVDRLFAPGIVVDISGRAAGDPDAVLQPDDLTGWEARHGAIPAGAVVLVHTGWSQRWPDWNRYYGSETPEDVSTLHFPGVSEAAARALVERRVAGVGIDTASIDPGISDAFQAHRVLAAAGAYNLENLRGLEGLPATGFLLVALPMKIADGTGGPARVVAVVNAAAGESDDQ